MLPFQVYVMYVDKIIDLGVIEPGDCSVISLINNAKKELSGQHIETWETWQLAITFLWNDLRYIPTTDAELMFCFEEFDCLEENNEENNAEPVEKINGEPENVEYSDDNPVGDAISYGSDGSAVENEYEVDEESKDDSDVIGNAMLTRDVIKRYAIHEGFTLKKIKNDNYRYTLTCKNDACDWRLRASCLMDMVTFMIKSVMGSHSMCPRVAENKEVTSRWIASVLGNFIHSNPTGKSRLFKTELHDRFAVKVDSQTIYRAKRIVLETLKIHHVLAYVKLKKQKGCSLALENEWLDAYTRYCFRHIIANFMATFKNHKMNGKLWHLARVTNRAGCNEAFASIKAESEKAAN
ncbi:hypothetical protein Dsin_018865 [Dipteronia sinensis]|uniref:Transposase MuDR plant domain-containing protein n=1 Tax=Dipteronia sinensis TaxID=43782 RepID=A0AAE0A6Z4_9ROSI|nr:hypothetical protein Dsin_018865 [Dipteronia sinensis]